MYRKISKYYKHKSYMNIQFTLCLLFDIGLTFICQCLHIMHKMDALRALPQLGPSSQSCPVPLCPGVQTVRTGLVCLTHVFCPCSLALPLQSFCRRRPTPLCLFVRDVWVVKLLIFCHSTYLYHEKLTSDMI